MSSALKTLAALLVFAVAIIVAPPAFATTSDEAGYRAQTVTLDRTGGYAGLHLRYTVDSRAGEPLAAAVTTTEFRALADHYPTPCCDQFTYTLTVRYTNGSVKSIEAGGDLPDLLADAIDRAVAVGTQRQITSERASLLVVLTGSGAPTWWTVDCPSASCAALTPAVRATFPPVPAEAPCTRIYGGPQRAHVLGYWSGERIDATFNRLGGCEIARWDAASGLLTPPAA
ncbi:hypothetical protein Afil01_25730 [Actinorhabdospora filicis]|uniref:Uncharacterized protein n=1 Tax=Actinorhabdospora filicis TaxID=1785913 RepID=A0A9W6W9P6_9ACTN|nr:protealysin inhibitor emfourin [Actinorhabdospora filicis]GLZ77766.1 hypothetical protein Afil01_25730 [Actinorhabdospora filicis]